MCLDGPTRDILVNYTPPGESVDLNFEMYRIELEFLSIHSEEVPTEKCDGDQFLNNRCRHMRKKSLTKVRLGRKRAKITKRLTSPLCPIREPIGMMGRKLEGCDKKRSRCGRNMMLYIILYTIYIYIYAPLV